AGAPSERAIRPPSQKLRFRSGHSIQAAGQVFQSASLLFFFFELCARTQCKTQTKMNPLVILEGNICAGKTTLGRALAAELGVAFHEESVPCKETLAA